jgi:exocyst complex component 2
MLLTLSNLQELRSEVVPSLTTQFENAFSVKLTDETKTIRDVLGQIDARLFRSYADPIVEELRAVVTQGILDPAWVPKRDDRPDDVKPYVYEALLRLVLVHSQVSTTTPTLTTQILSFLLEQLSMALLETFKKRNSYPLSSLMQATFDVEFVAQTLSQYTTDRAGSLHMEIYQELDKATDNESRKALQIELQDMRTVLRRLRETTKSEFACFKRSRKAAEQAPAH